MTPLAIDASTGEPPTLGPPPESEVRRRNQSPSIDKHDAKRPPLPGATDVVGSAMTQVKERSDLHRSFDRSPKKDQLSGAGTQLVPPPLDHQRTLLSSASEGKGAPSVGWVTKSARVATAGPGHQSSGVPLSDCQGGSRSSVAGFFRDQQESSPLTP